MVQDARGQSLTITEDRFTRRVRVVGKSDEQISKEAAIAVADERVYVTKDWIRWELYEAVYANKINVVDVYYVWRKS